MQARTRACSRGPRATAGKSARVLLTTFVGFTTRQAPLDCPKGCCVNTSAFLFVPACASQLPSAPVRVRASERVGARQRGCLASTLRGRACADSEAQHACRSAVAYLKHHPLFDAQLTGLEALPSHELPLPSPEETDLLPRGCAKRKRGREGAEVGSTGVGAWRVLVASAAPLRRGRVEQPAALTTRATCGRH
jgi:hypothetical protein